MNNQQKTRFSHLHHSPPQQYSSSAVKKKAFKSVIVFRFFLFYLLSEIRISSSQSSHLVHTKVMKKVTMKGKA